MNAISYKLLMKCISLFSDFNHQLQNYKKVLTLQSNEPRNITWHNDIMPQDIMSRPGKRGSCRGGSQRVMGGIWIVRGGCRLSSSAKWRTAKQRRWLVRANPCDLAVCFSQWMKCWLGPDSPLLRGHFGANDILCASETDADDYEGHVRDSEMTFWTFP